MQENRRDRRGCRSSGRKSCADERILNSESFQKPGLTKCICDHFSINARILLEPLAKLEAKKRNQSPGDVRGMSGPFEYAFFGRDYSVNEGNVNREIVPDGLHLMIR